MKAVIPPEISAGVARESLGIEVTTRCNASCSYCFVRSRSDRPSDLAAKAVRDIIADGYRLGYRNLHLSGGEPFLWGGLRPTIEYASRFGFQTILINTNGILLTPEVSRQLAGYGTVWVSVSLQGPKAFHCRRRDQDHYQLIRDNIAAALDAELVVSLFTTVFKGLLQIIPEFTHDMFVAYPGLRCLAFIQLIRVPVEVVDLSREMLAPDEFLTLVQTAALLRLCGLKVDVLNNPLVGTASKVIGLPWEALSHPLSAPGRLMIRANGDITTSHSARRCLGRYRAGRLQDILASPLYVAAVTADDTSCSGCGFFDLCRSTGMLRPSEPYRDKDGRDFFCRRVLECAYRQSRGLVPQDTVPCSGN